MRRLWANLYSLYDPKKSQRMGKFVQEYKETQEKDNSTELPNLNPEKIGKLKIKGKDILLFQCDECGKSFLSKSHLDNHKNAHTDVTESYECNLSNVNVRNTQKFQCEECEKSFTSKSRLNIHKRGHSGFKLDECKACGKTLTHCNCLQRHQNSKEYKCEDCGRMFAYYNALKAHKKWCKFIQDYKEKEKNES